MREAIQRTHKYWEKSTIGWTTILLIACCVALGLSAAKMFMGAVVVIMVPLMFTIASYSHKLNAEKLLGQDYGTQDTD